MAQEIIVYSGFRCKPCDAVKAFLKENGYSYVEKNTHADTEVPIKLPDRVAPATALTSLKQATIALITTGGLVRKGNPDRQSSGNPTRYYRHAITELESQRHRLGSLPRRLL